MHMYVYLSLYIYVCERCSICCCQGAATSARAVTGITYKDIDKYIHSYKNKWICIYLFICACTYIYIYMNKYKKIYMGVRH